MFRGLDITLEITDLMGVITACEDTNILNYAYESRDYFRNAAGGTLVSQEELSTVLQKNLETIIKGAIPDIIIETGTAIDVLTRQLEELFETPPGT
jgi:hypothetical protein